MQKVDAATVDAAAGRDDGNGEELSGCGYPLTTVPPITSVERKGHDRDSDLVVETDDSAGVWWRWRQLEVLLCALEVFLRQMLAMVPPLAACIGLALPKATASVYNTREAAHHNSTHFPHPRGCFSSGERPGCTRRMTRG